MRATGAVTALATAMLVLVMASPSHAAWCAVYSPGGTNCGFSTFQSCQASVRGVGGSCQQAPGKRSKPARQRVYEQPQPRY